MTYAELFAAVAELVGPNETFRIQVETRRDPGARRADMRTYSEWWIFTDEAAESANTPEEVLGRMRAIYIERTEMQTLEETFATKPGVMP